jgi:hypothetical protein
MSAKRLVPALCAGGFLLMVAGCAEKLTYERWKTIHIGAPTEAVEETLGDPWEREFGTWVYYDSDRSVTATAIFDEEGKLIKKTWNSPDIQDQEPEMGLEPGQSEETNVKEFDIAQ